LGDVPPEIAISHITRLKLDEQTIGAVVRFAGNAEIECSVDLNLNTVGGGRAAKEVNRYMGIVYSDAPVVSRCRFSVSQVAISVAVEITHKENVTIRFQERPSLSFSIDSNLSSLGPLFESGLARVVKMANKAFAALPQDIEIPIPKLES
jgi:hypothetical protein